MMRYPSSPQTVIHTYANFWLSTYANLINFPKAARTPVKKEGKPDFLLLLKKILYSFFIFKLFFFSLSIFFSFFKNQRSCKRARKSSSVYFDISRRISSARENKSADWKTWGALDDWRSQTSRKTCDPASKWLIFVQLEEFTSSSPEGRENKRKEAPALR